MKKMAAAFLLWFSSRRVLLATALVFLFFIIALTWLNKEAKIVRPDAHESYVYKLRDLGELESQINSELLANRLELSRNYDALTRDTQKALQVAQELKRFPDFLGQSNKVLMAPLVDNLISDLVKLSGMVDHFKRDNSVLRNSLAFFPTISAEIIDSPLLRDDTVLYRETSFYVRQVLAFARAPDAETLFRARMSRVVMEYSPFNPAQREGVDKILRHGDIIMERMIAMDALLNKILARGSIQIRENLVNDYSEGYLVASMRAERYSIFLYLFAIALLVYLANTFWRLSSARSSLLSANEELNARYQAQLLLEEKLRLHATAFINAHDGIILTDAKSTILDVNPAFTRITGWSHDEVIGKNPRMLNSGRHDREFYANLWQCVHATGNWRGEVWNRNKYGEIYPELLSISAVKDEKDNFINYVAVFADISRVKTQETQLVKLAYYDPLTDLPNRSLLSDRLGQAMQQTKRSKEMMAIAYLDLDGFKPVNERLGQDSGDDILIEMGLRLKDALRGGDTVSRFGGDEFVLLLLDIHDEKEMQLTFDRLLATIAKPIFVANESIELTGSMGVTLFPEDNSDPDTLLRHADLAMYQAKQLGKARYHLFDPEEDRFVRSHHDHISNIREALGKKEFVLYYQPKVDMRQGKVIGAEALIRWKDPIRGILAPGEFLPQIENDEIIIDIGDWVIETALTHMEMWKTLGHSICVSVNVAGLQLQHHDFVKKLSDALARHPSVATQLEMEVLETAALEDMTRVSQTITACVDMGVNFSLDDFGTGYSSLSYLKRLPAETIKIDQSFVRDLLGDPHNLTIIQGVLGLARAFQRRAIAEGVESVAHGRMLLQVDCDLAQGYGIARPMAEDIFLDWIKTWKPDPSWDAVKDCYWEEADLPLIIAEPELRAFVSQSVHIASESLRTAIPHIGECKNCRLGRWYYNNDHAKKSYGELAAYQQIEPLHHQLHDIAFKMNTLCVDGQSEVARTMIGQVIETRDRLLAALHELQFAVAKKRR